MSNNMDSELNEEDYNDARAAIKTLYENIVRSHTKTVNNFFLKRNRTKRVPVRAASDAIIVSLPFTKVKVPTVMHVYQPPESVEIRVKHFTLINSLPKMCNWAPIQKDFLVEESETSNCFLPYFGDNVDDAFYDELLKDYREFYDKKYCDHEVFELIRKLLNFDKQKASFPLLANFLEKIKIENSFEDEVYNLVISALSLDVSKEKLKKNYEWHSDKKVQNSATTLNIEANTVTIYRREESVHSFMVLYCLRHFIYDCNVHLYNEKNQSLVSYDPVKRNAIMRKLETNQICGDFCHKKVKDTSIGDWPVADKNIFNVLAHYYPNDFCQMSQILGKKCCEVAAYSHCLGDVVLAPENVDVIENNNGKKKGKKRQKLYSLHVKKFLMKNGEHKQLSSYVPCSHNPGEKCDKDCPCVENEVYCEKFCKCSKECEQRFQGCKCKAQCNTRQCPCYVAIRECDPDLCQTCGSDSIESTRCKNVSIQRGQRKHLLLGISQVAGWGIYLNEEAQKNEFISEYCGEILNQDEADRRGKIYDQNICSFLFNLNNEFVIDAFHKGNKIRFANHSCNPNCFTKVMMVNGDHRIGIYAKKKIEKGEELFFDYRYHPKDSLKFVNIELKNT